VLSSGLPDSRSSAAPAQLAGLADLHAFLENGFAAFVHMGRAADFLDCVEQRERALLERLFAGVADPFAA